MLNLKMETDPRWVNVAEADLEEVLTDHAYCEQKAASNAISLMILYPDLPGFPQRMSELAREELEHYEMVLQKLEDRGMKLGWERKDPYIGDLRKFMKSGGSREETMVERLLFAAMVEARSCERFKVLSENIQDEDLSAFYRELMISEAGHYTLFIKFAKEFAKDVDVDKRWEEFLEYEASVIRNYGNSSTIHG